MLTKSHAQYLDEWRRGYRPAERLPRIPSPIERQIEDDNRGREANVRAAMRRFPPLRARP